MRAILILVLLTASLADAAWRNYEETRNLTLDTSGVDILNINAGAGSLDVAGISGSNEIEVTAVVKVPGRNEDKARKKIESEMVLTLDKDGDTAVLKAYFDRGLFGFGDSPVIDVEVRLPEGLRLFVDDGSGSTQIRNVRGDVSIDDGSGSLTMVDVGGNVEIDDGSGSILVKNVGADISIIDGSGSIKVRGVGGSVIVDDGSGGIDVSDVKEDLTIVDDGSGSLDISEVAGRVETGS